MTCLYSSDKGDTAHIIGSEARPFKFEVQQQRDVYTIPTMTATSASVHASEREAPPGDRQLCWGSIATSGTINLVSRTPIKLEEAFDLEVFSGGRHQATLRSVMPTCTLHEYNLADRYIYEIQFVAKAIEKPQQTGE